MIAQLLDGRALADRLNAETRELAEGVAKATGRRSKLVVVTAGDDPASKVYVRQKARVAEACGIECEVIRKSASVSAFALMQVIDELNRRDDVDGIIVQLPLPKAIKDAERDIINRIMPCKDADGLTNASQGALMSGGIGLQPCTAKGVKELLKANMSIAGKRVCIIGRSLLVGKPLAALLTDEDCTVTLCHSKTENILKHTWNADIIVCAVGKKGFLTGEMVPKGCVVVDVGINRVDAGIVGDCAPEVALKAGWLTPVPGGVGPMTVAELMRNVLIAREMR